MIGKSNVIRASICKALGSVKGRTMIYEDKVKCLKTAIGFVSVILEIDDYLVSKPDQLDVKQPGQRHWDED